MNLPPTSWRIIGASVTGTSHGKTGTPCQDAHAFRCLPNGTAVLVASDGAGSAERSAQGANAAVETALDALAQAVVQAWPASDEDWQALFQDVSV